ncbi:hypothetical protein ID866_3666 [Astraeus odoratus]|nr:hypothetical protein ID866_3666 [Astraeus odoratus]
MSTTPLSDAMTGFSTNDHLWIPDPEPSETPNEQTASSSHSAQLLKDRLYVGNLGPVVDEYTLLQVFSKFGKVSKLDFLFHKAGPNRGKPRGYAFIEFTNEADATKALEGANGKLLRGRKLVVTFAHQAPLHSLGSTTSQGGKMKRADNTPTTLSLVKSTGVGRSEAKTSSKIAMMEAKLRQMQSSSPFADKPSLPAKPHPLTNVTPEFPKGNASRRSRAPAAEMRSRLPGTQDSTGSATSQAPPETCEVGSELAASKIQTGLSDMVKPPSSHKKSIPGVKIVKSRPK